MTRPLLIGQAPGPRTDPELPLYPIPKTSAGGRLQTMMGLSRGQYLERFDRVNLLSYFPGKHKRDDKFPMTPAKLAALVVKPLLADRVVILVGRNVAQVFGFQAEFYDWVDWPVRRYCPLQKSNCHARVVCIPHPSGRNRWYNNPENREVTAAFWQEFLSEDKKVLSFVSGESM